MLKQRLRQVSGSVVVTIPKTDLTPPLRRPAPDEERVGASGRRWLPYLPPHG